MAEKAVMIAGLQAIADIYGARRPDPVVMSVRSTLHPVYLTLTAILI